MAGREGSHWGMPGNPEQRVQRAAGRLRADATFLEHVAHDEGIYVPQEVVEALATIRQWTRSLGAADPEGPVVTRARQAAVIPARPRRRDGWKYRL
jgi:hypothetical protein